MIGISNKTIYAIAAIYQLTLIKKEERLKIKEIASRAEVPQKFLEQILLELKKSAILKSTKGAKGGYSLAKPISEITLKDIIKTLENNPFSDMCKTNNPILKYFWKEKKRALEELFNTPLDQLKTYQDEVSKNFNYMI